jgi:Protein of unknown function (DUF3572)
VTLRTPNDAADPFALALAALAATLTDERRARRFLDLTGIETEELRRRAGEPRLLSALIGFLEAHEPDLLSVSQAIGVKPEALVAARLQIDQGNA